jgi:hypothetical protein
MKRRYDFAVVISPSWNICIAEQRTALAMAKPIEIEAVPNGNALCIGRP